MSRRHARMKGHTREEKKPSPVVVGQARSWKEFKAGREARIEREVSRLLGNAIGLARGLGEPGAAGVYVRWLPVRAEVPGQLRSGECGRVLRGDRQGTE